MTNTNQSPSLEAFVTRLIAEKYPSALDPAFAAQVKDDLNRQVEDRLKAAIFANIPEDKLEEFNRLLDEENQDALQQFVAEAIPNLAELTAQTLLELRTSYLA